VKVTPLDIRRKEFKHAMRGYADEEVDVFLDEVADEMERLHQENTQLQERMRRLEEQTAGHQQLRDALEKTLVSAQLQADETRAQAQKEHDQIVQAADLKARGIVGESYGEVQKLQASLLQLKQLEEDFRFKFRSLLEGHLRLLAEPPITVAAGQAAMASVPVAPAAVAPQPVAPPPVAAQPVAPQPVAQPAPQPAPYPAPESPFVMPTAIQEVPEYPSAAAAPVRFDPPAAVPAPPAQAPAPPAAPVRDVPAALVAEAGPTPPGVEAQPAAVVIERLPVFQQADMTQVQPARVAPVLWPEDVTMVVGKDEAPTGERSAAFPYGNGTGQYATPVSDREAQNGVTDESVTLVKDEDPLRTFFFGPKGQAADNFFESDKGGKSKTRDFEW
jgi:cell division initiation protein